MERVRPAPLRVSTTALPLYGSAAVNVDGSDRDGMVTPDGPRIVYVGRNGTQMFVRSLDQVDPVAIVTASGTIRGVFTSPGGDLLPPYDTELTLEGKPVGRVTSAARDPEHGVVALAYLRREVAADTVLAWTGGTARQI